MPVSRVGSVQSILGTNTGWACVLPATQAGDVAFTFVGKRASGNPTTVPTGYTLLDPQDVSGGNVVWLSCYAKVLAAGDSGATHTWAWASTTAQALCLILRGIDPAQVLSVTDPPTGTTTNATTVATPASTAQAGDWALWIGAMGTNGVISFPATQDAYTVTRELGASSGLLGVAFATYAAAKAVSALTITTSVSGRTIGKTLVAKIAPPPSVWQRWTGAAWSPAVVQRWDGTQWVTATVKRWNGSSWQ